MCAYYQDETTKIKKGDQSTYRNQAIKIISVTHVKSNKTMDIRYVINGKEKQLPVIPYHGFIEGLYL